MPWFFTQKHLDRGVFGKRPETKTAHSTYCAVALRCIGAFPTNGSKISYRDTDFVGKNT
jgi:hypothetical protein